MLSRIPFRSASGVVSNGYGQGKGVGQLGLELGFPGTTAATVAAAGIGQNEQLAGTAIAGRTFLVPPMSNGMSGKGGGIVGNANHQSTAIFHYIVNPIGNGDPDGIGAEVVIIDAKRADSQQRPGFLKGRQVRFLLSSAIPPNHSLPLDIPDRGGAE